EICEEYNIPTKPITNDAMKALQALPWTGNIRELRNMVERLIILSGKEITDTDVNMFANPSVSTHNSKVAGTSMIDLDRMETYGDFLNFAEEKFLVHKLNKNGGDIGKTAHIIGISEDDLKNKLQKF